MWHVHCFMKLMFQLYVRTLCVCWVRKKNVFLSVRLFKTLQSSYGSELLTVQSSQIQLWTTPPKALRSQKYLLRQMYLLILVQILK